ncbi:hypothetical protein [Sorangium sp. So ce1335]|uniref:hypothetical protein n=1 Tax=Sorangium sp. So ce1335 TaxID=3133335 RepID=UPI003F602B30
MRHLRQLFVCSVLAVVTVPVGCGTEAPDGAEDASDVGSIRLSLVGTSVTGATYRLSNAWFDIVGPTSRLVHGDGDTTALTEVLPVGRYDVYLQPGWLLERWTGSGYQQVPAALTSPNPTPVFINEGAPSTVAFQFRADDEVVSVGQGTLDIVIGVDDVTTGREDSDAACSNGHDDDGDGLADCADPDCQWQLVCPIAGTLIDGFEDGDFHATSPYAGSHPPFTGPWMTWDDGTIPRVDLYPVAGAFSPTGLGVYAPEMPSAAGAGVILSFDGGPVEMVGFEGIRFYVRGQGAPVRFEIGTLLTMPEGGLCSDCYDHHGVDLWVGPEWTPVELPWWDLTQQGWGTRVPFDPWYVMSLIWRSPAGQPLAIEIDDVQLF